MHCGKAALLGRSVCLIVAPSANNAIIVNDKEILKGLRHVSCYCFEERKKIPDLFRRNRVNTEVFNRGVKDVLVLHNLACCFAGWGLFTLEWKELKLCLPCTSDTSFMQGSSIILQGTLL